VGNAGQEEIVRQQERVKRAGAVLDKVKAPRGRLDDLNADAASILCQLPGVVKVDVARPDTPTRHRIVHFKDWHFIPRDVFAADVRDQAEEPVSEAQIDDLYEGFLSEVEAVQAEQKAVLRCLIKHHGLHSVF
jgi:hypothetical protein